MTEITKTIIKKLENVTLDHITTKGDPAKFNRASSIGWVDDCPRYLCLQRLCPEKAEEKSIEGQRRLDEGNKQEGLIRADMKDAGFKLIPTKDDPKVNAKLRLRGEADDILDAPPKIVVDYKSCSDNMFNVISRCQNPDDLRTSKFIWLRHYVPQMWSYIFLYGIKVGLLLFKNKDSGQPHAIEVPEDEDRFNYYKNGLDYINECVEKKDPPEAEYKEDACKRCGFYAYCFEGKTDIRKEQIERIEDAELEAMFDRRGEVVDAGKEFTKLDKAIKSQLKGKTVVVGNWLFKTSSFTAISHDVPKEIKSEYAFQVERFRGTIKQIVKAL